MSRSSSEAISGIVGLAAAIGMLVAQSANAQAQSMDTSIVAARQAALEAGDAVLGEAVFKKCRACHQIGDGAKNRTGPVLSDVVGRLVASVEGYKYSSAFGGLKTNGLVWTADKLDAFLTRPRGFARSTKMTFAGLKDEDDRRNVIAYLASFSPQDGVAEVNPDTATVDPEPPTPTMPGESVLSGETSPDSTASAATRVPQSVAQPPNEPTWADVRQLFVKYNCVECHAGEDAPLGLRLDTLENTLAGGENGPVLLAGQPSDSALLQRVGSQAELRMPLTGPPFLTAEEIGLLENWVTAGLPAGAMVEADQLPPVPARPGPDDTVTFTHVRSLFLKRCAKCHKDNGLLGRPPEQLRLDSYENIIAGGERVVLLPSNPGLSEIIRRVEGKSDPRMPMDGPPWLADEDIALLRQWVEQGARDQDGTPAAIPVGRKVRFRGLMTGSGSIDGEAFTLHGGTRIDKSPRLGDEIEVRGHVTSGGEVVVDRLRRR